LDGCSHLQPRAALEFPPLPGPDLDQGFFRATGIVMILGTLMMGAITLSLAIGTGTTEPTNIVASAAQ
jgi:hypothetical protein